MRYTLLVANIFFVLRLSGQVNRPTAEVQPPSPTVIIYHPVAYAPNQPLNYVRSWTPQRPYTDEGSVTSATREPSEVQRVTQYMDGLGRPLQTVSWRSSPGQTDVVQPVLYDALGREQYQFLPYAGGSDGSFKSNPFGEQSSFYSGSYLSEQPAFSGEQLLYSQTNFEPSPLQRVLKRLAPGNSWVGNDRGVSLQYQSNQAADQVMIWDIGFDANIQDNTNIPFSNSTYGAGQLYKTITTDEQGKQTVEYKDKEGQVVLKKVQLSASPSAAHQGWLCTYYVYDALGQLRFVVPPQATDVVLSSGTLDASSVSELCFRYEYDSRQRLIAKKIPGAGWVYMVYDQRDRLVFSQDATMRSKGWWLYTLYDPLNRPVQTGMLSGYVGGRAGLQAYVNSLPDNTAPVSGSGSYAAAVAADLSVAPGDQRPLYQASNSIEFQEGFTSPMDASFVAEIVPAPTAGFTSSQAVQIHPVPPGYPLAALTYTYYDDYSWTAKSYTSANNGQLLTGNNPYGEPVPTTPGQQVRGLVTGTRVRVLENAGDLSAGRWLETVRFYDDKGRAVQVQSDNYKGGQDILSSRYDFTGKVISTYQVHNNPQAGLSNHRVATEMDYDAGGRLLEVRKTVNDDRSRTRIVSRLGYDQLGRLKSKQTGQRADASGQPQSGYLEQDDYAYNIRGWLKGINWLYGSPSPSGTSGTVNPGGSKWFAMDLSYDWGYEQNHYNGNIAGMRWKSGGDGQYRSYGYGYDAASRLLFGDFKQYTNGSWNNSAGVDFSLKMGDGQTGTSAYDANGNILQLQQWGLSGPASKQLDNLTYGYSAHSNKLLQVADAVAGGGSKLGDFQDQHSGTDYAYDANGNLVQDLNKQVSAILYNHLNLPFQVTVAGKGTITYIYDATGAKLEKRTAETASTANGNLSRNTVTSYLGSYVYENNQLQFFGQEEGRIRPKKDGNGQVQYEVYDYYLKDHLGNVRIVLTDEQQTDQYPAATLESGAVAAEQAYYDIQEGNIVAKSSIPGFSAASGQAYPNHNGNPPYNTNPTSNTVAESQRLYRLNAGSNKTGLGMTLKVMAGDQLNVYGRSYYFQNSTGSNNSAVAVEAILGGLLGGATGGAATGQHGPVTVSQLLGDPATVNPVSSFLSSHPDNTTPKAYINYLLFDEQFHCVGTGASPVGGNSVVKDHRSELQGIQVAKNGYLYVYCSNESPVDVFFDNLQVVHARGPLLEETHYYPFGLTMSGISSKAAGSTENKYKFNGKELQSKEFTDGSGLELNDYGKRMQDPQLGRWWVLDPKADLLEMSSPYVFCYNNPIIYKDPDGELAILINGRVTGESQRGNASYWDNGIIEAIKSSGIPNSSNMMFVDGDRYYNHVLRHDFDRTGEEGVKNGSYLEGNYPSERREAGYTIGKQEFQNILSKLAKDPSTGKVIEKIQIYTHSRGAAFGAGYIDALLEMIKQNADKFAGPNSVIDLVYNMAPHQSNSIDEPGGSNAYSQDHTWDPLSGNDMSGIKGAFSSNEGGSLLGQHATKSFVKDITAFTKSFVANGNNSQQLINDFIKKMKDDYDITVTVKQ